MRIRNTLRPDRRRDALAAVFKKMAIGPQEAARRAGFPSASAINNFLSGRADSLNIETYESLADALNTTVTELLGLPEVPGRNIYLAGSVATGTLRTARIWPREQWVSYVMPQTPARDSYLLRLETTEMDEVWAPGTILEVVNLGDFRGDLRAGNRVIVLRTTAAGELEVCCRQIAAHDGNRCMLVTRSREPRFRDLSISFAWPLRPQIVETLSDGSTAMISAVVVRSIIDETS